MATNFKQPGEILTLTAPYARSSGQAALVGAIFGVALQDVENAASGQFKTCGVFELAKTAAQQWALGDRIYWNAGTKLVSNVATDGLLVGVATAAAANPSATGFVKIGCGVSGLLEGPQAAIADIADIAGGESPTEAEHNAALAKINAILAVLRTVGIIAT